jgi:plasmid replication initiation protein
MTEKKHLVKSNDLIEARYRLSLQESRLVLWLVSQIDYSDTDFQTHKLSIQEFSKIIGLNFNGQYTEIQEVTERLMQRVLKIRDPEKKEFTQISWLSFAKYQEGEGVVHLRFDPALKPYLLQLKEQFSIINIDDLFNFKSMYALRIYELLLQYASIGKRDISLDDLREYCGISINEYKLYSNLRLKVIDTAKKEINEKTHYLVDYTEGKKSRKVEKINWIIAKKNQEKQDSVMKYLPPVEKSIDEMCQHKIKEITEFCKTYENKVRGIQYLLNVTGVKIEKDTLKLTFSSPFFKSQCESNIVLVDRLGRFFKTKHVELLDD